MLSYYIILVNINFFYMCNSISCLTFGLPLHAQVLSNFKRASHLKVHTSTKKADLQSIVEDFLLRCNHLRFYNRHNWVYLVFICLMNCPSLVIIKSIMGNIPYKHLFVIFFRTILDNAI